ncbi:MAG: class and aminotransferase [Clostridia bacterium]|nr:class and aminotransferase [Clostridia bacterium]
MYKFYCGTGELDMTVLNKDNTSLNIDVNEIIQTVKKKNIDFLILSNPCNPTGVGIKRKDIINIIENCNCTVCIDEAYMDFWSESVIELVPKYDNLLVLKTCSKNFGLAALRLGFTIAGEKLLTPIKKAKSPYNVNSLSQTAGTVILKHKDFLKKATAEIINKKNELYSNLKKLEKNDFTVINTNTNFITVKTPMAKDIYDFLLKNNIVIRCLGSDLLRITTGSEDENMLLLTALREAL